MKRNDFFEQYKSPEWQKKRLEILQRDEFTCQVCGDKESQLNVHHRIYFKDTKVWAYDNHLLITLCELCHDDAHMKREYLNNVLSKVHEMFLADYCCIVDTLARFDPYQLEVINEFLQKMFPIKNNDSDAKFYL
jgi:hypothetical protein